MKPNIPYRPEIDALRAVAVILVILFHAQLGIFPGGFIGVDVFFVISGYLITSIIMAKMDTGAFTVKGFYASRVRRICPALLAMTAITALVCMAVPIYGGSAFPWLKRFIASVILFCSNIYIFLNTGYFDAGADSQVFLHTWSLSVEAQFYALYPLFLLLAKKRWPKRLNGIFLGGTLLGLAIATLFAEIVPKAAFFFLPTRAWELLLGGLVAVRGTSRQGENDALAASGLGLIMVSALTYGRFLSPAFPGIWALPPCLGAAMFIMGASTQGHPSAFKKALGWKPLVALGLISYSLYLWHWPIFVVFRRVSLDVALSPASFLALCALTLAISIASYATIERPARMGLARFSAWRQLLGFAALATALSTLTLTYYTPSSLFSTGYAKIQASTEKYGLDKPTAVQKKLKLGSSRL